MFDSWLTQVFISIVMHIRRNIYSPCKIEHSHDKLMLYSQYFYRPIYMFVMNSLFDDCTFIFTRVIIHADAQTLWEFSIFSWFSKKGRAIKKLNCFRFFFLIYKLFITQGKESKPNLYKILWNLLVFVRMKYNG